MAVGECPPQKHNFYLEINYGEQNGYLKILMREMVGVEGVLVAFQSLSTIKKGTSHFNFQSNEAFLKFLRECFLCKPYMPQGHNYNLQPLPCGL